MAVELPDVETRFAKILSGAAAQLFDLMPCGRDYGSVLAHTILASHHLKAYTNRQPCCPN
jgi:hypothetical protein